MIACLLLLVTYIVFPAFPALGFLAACGAVWSASYWDSTAGEGVELIFFYGAIAGLLLAFLG